MKTETVDEDEYRELLKGIAKHRRWANWGTLLAGIFGLVLAVSLGLRGESLLISGFIEQAVKEIILEHASATSSGRIRKYVEGTWPNSKNMRCDAIREILGHLDQAWSASFDAWLQEDERKKEINEIISWRNDIAHGKESNTNNVTLSSVSTKFQVACQLVDFIEALPQAPAA